MPSKKQYNLVSDDSYDSRIPLYNEEAFQHGISFHAKYIGSLDVPRPSSRIEIVAAMRRIRFEFKSKSLKKKKVSINVSVDGLKVILRTKKRSNQWPWDESKFVILHHPIYRIFYVSHDSQDLKIFSYIARDGGTNSFKCNVFKSKKKSQAMRIVRTIGQAFEVCHKLSLAMGSTSGGTDEQDIDANQSTKSKSQGDGASEPNSCDTQEELSVLQISEASTSQSPQKLNGKCLSSPLKQENVSPTSKLVHPVGGAESLSSYHHVQLLKEQLEQQNQQLQAVMGQMQLIKDQLAAENSARLEAQSQNHHLLAHNKELLQHIHKLVGHIEQIEAKSQKPELAKETTFPDPFLQLASFDASTYQASKFPSSSSERGALSKDQSFQQKPMANSIGRQLSVPGSISSQKQSPKHAVTFENSVTSLPGSPLDRNILSNLDNLFRPNTFVASSPKISRTDRQTDGENGLSSQSSSILRSTSSSLSPRNNNVFDFEVPSLCPKFGPNGDLHSPKLVLSSSDKCGLSELQFGAAVSDFSSEFYAAGSGANSRSPLDSGINSWSPLGSGANNWSPMGPNTNHRSPSSSSANNFSSGVKARSPLSSSSINRYPLDCDPQFGATLENPMVGDLGRDMGAFFDNGSKFGSAIESCASGFSVSCPRDDGDGKESFIAQMTKDLARLNTAEKNLSDTELLLKAYGDSASLYKS